jgi:hypothetical protein
MVAIAGPSRLPLRASSSLRHEICGELSKEPRSGSRASARSGRMKETNVARCERASTIAAADTYRATVERPQTSAATPSAPDRMPQASVPPPPGPAVPAPPPGLLADIAATWQGPHDERCRNSRIPVCRGLAHAALGMATSRGHPATGFSHRIGVGCTGDRSLAETKNRTCERRS